MGRPSSNKPCARPRCQRGFTLIDVLVLIVLVGTVSGSMMMMFSRLAQQSAQSLRDRQTLAMAQTLLDEVRMMPMTYCDLQDANAGGAGAAALGGGNCTTTVDALGPEPGEGRYNPPATRFDGVSDYHGLALPGPGCAGICDAAGNPLNPAGSALAACTAQITTTPQAMPGVAALDVNGRPQALRIVVRVRCPGQADTVVDAVRMRFAPRGI